MKHGRALTPAEDRFAMVRAAIEGDARFAASRREIDRVGETYTVDTLRELRRFLPARVELCFLMGADAAARLGEWREASELGGLARFAVVSQRDDVSLDGRDLSRLAQIIDAREILQVAMPRMDVSSTDLRKKVRQGRSIRDEVQRLWQTISSHTGSTSAESLDVCKGRLIWPRPNRRKKKRS